MFYDPNESLARNHDESDIALMQMLDTFVRRTPDPELRWQEYQEDPVAEAEKAPYWSRLQPATPWYRPVSVQVGHWLVAAGRRLESRGARGTLTSPAETASP